MHMQEEIVTWAEEKGIFKKSSFMKQMKGLVEEPLEAVEAYVLYKTCCGPISDLQEEMGDIYIWWINACATIGLNPDVCVEMAFTKVAGRTGQMKNGRFVKDEI